VLILAPDAQDDAWAGGLNQRIEFYDMSGFPHGGQFLGLLAVLRVTQVRDRRQVAPEQSPVDGPREIQLVYSPDGLEWRRYSDRCYVISRGEPGSYVAGSILGVSNPPVVYNDEVWEYYTAMTTTHGGALPEKRMSIGRASWRLDGFVSLDGDFQGGIVETVPLIISGNRLEINVDASHARAAVEVLSADGRVLPGYALEDCRAICSDEVHPLGAFESERALEEQPTYSTALPPEERPPLQLPDPRLELAVLIARKHRPSQHRLPGDSYTGGHRGSRCGSSDFQWSNRNARDTD
jgi:hypothetical protein